MSDAPGLFATRLMAMMAAAIIATSCGGTAADEHSASSAKATASLTSAARATTTSSPPPTTTIAAADTTTVPPSTTVATTAPTAVVPSPPVATVDTAGSLRGRVIVIDPGQNGANGAHTREISEQVDAGGFTKDCNTTGTAGGDLSESRFNWEAALIAKATLEKAGATVVLTSESDDGVGPCVDVRGRTSSLVGAQAMVSIHADGSTVENHGFHVIHPSSIKGYTDLTKARSDQLATALRDSLVAKGWSPSTYIGDHGLDERGDLGTLNRSSVPSVMVECGNMKNGGDLALLASPQGKAQLADAILLALQQFFS